MPEGLSVRASFYMYNTRQVRSRLNSIGCSSHFQWPLNVSAIGTEFAAVTCFGASMYCAVRSELTFLPVAPHCTPQSPPSHLFESVLCVVHCLSTKKWLPAGVQSALQVRSETRRTLQDVDCFLEVSAPAGASGRVLHVCIKLACACLPFHVSLLVSTACTTGDSLLMHHAVYSSPQGTMHCFATDRSSSPASHRSWASLWLRCSRDIAQIRC